MNDEQIRFESASIHLARTFSPARAHPALAVLMLSGSGQTGRNDNANALRAIGPVASARGSPRVRGARRVAVFPARENARGRPDNCNGEGTRSAPLLRRRPGPAGAPWSGPAPDRPLPCSLLAPGCGSRATAGWPAGRCGGGGSRRVAQKVPKGAEARVDLLKDEAVLGVAGGVADLAVAAVDQMQFGRVPLPGVDSNERSEAAVGLGEGPAVRGSFPLHLVHGSGTGGSPGQLGGATGGGRRLQVNDGLADGTHRLLGRAEHTESGFDHSVLVIVVSGLAVLGDGIPLGGGVMSWVMP